MSSRIAIRILRAAGTLNETMYGPSEDLDRAASVRRTVYGRVSRARLSNLLKLYDFPDPDANQSGPRSDHDVAAAALRDEQRVHRGQSAALVKAVEDEPRRSVQSACPYRQLLSRDPSQKELDSGGGLFERGHV